MFIQEIQNILDEAKKRYEQGEEIEQKDKIPLDDDIPLETNKWLKIDDVVCVFIQSHTSTLAFSFLLSPPHRFFCVPVVL